MKDGRFHLNCLIFHVFFLRGLLNALKQMSIDFITLSFYPQVFKIISCQFRLGCRAYGLHFNLNLFKRLTEFSFNKAGNVLWRYMHRQYNRISLIQLKSSFFKQKLYGVLHKFLKAFFFFFVRKVPKRINPKQKEEKTLLRP